jgi:hypothetical protein
VEAFLEQIGDEPVWRIDVPLPAPAAGDTQRTAHEAVDRVAKAIVQHEMRIIEDRLVQLH